MTLNCIIIDDEPLAIELLKRYVEQTPFLCLIGTYSSAVEALADNSSNKDVNLIFLDIQMPQLSGLEYSSMVNPETRIIFTTAFNKYAIDGFKVNAVDYLLKPISYSDFITAAKKALQWFELKTKAESNETKTLQDNCIFVKSDYKWIRIAFDDILYIEGLKDYVKIVLENQQKSILSLISMKALEEKLPAIQFIRVHRSFIVQKSKIKIIDRGRIVFGKEYIPISESYKQNLQSYLNDHSI